MCYLGLRTLPAYTFRRGGRPAVAIAATLETADLVATGGSPRRHLSSVRFGSLGDDLLTDVESTMGLEE